MITIAKLGNTKGYLKRLVKFYIKALRQKTPEFFIPKKRSWGTLLISKSESYVPKIIWIYWHDYKINSSTIKLCLEQMIKLHPSFDVRIVNSSNLINFLPNFPTIDDSLPLANVSDLIRLMLLENYGGLYLDASVLVLKKLDWILSDITENGAEALVYYTDENTSDLRYPMIETWCIAAIPQSKFIKSWRQEYQKCLQSPEPDKYYLNHHVLNVSQFHLDPVYHKCYFAAQVVMRLSQDYKLYLICAEDDGFLYSLGIKDKWSDISMAEILLMNERPKSYPNLIKIVNSSRQRIDSYIDMGLMKRKSIIWSLKSVHEVVR